MKTLKSFMLAATLATLATNAFALPLDLEAGGAPKLKTTKVQLGVKSPADNACPGNGELTAWVFTNKPGSVPILIVAQNGPVYGPFMVETKKGANGLSMGTYSKPLNAPVPIDTAYRVVTPKTAVASNWVPFKADC